MSNINNVQKVRSTFVTILFLVLGVWLFTASIQIIDAGETGVYFLFGKV
jgi:hypothetical protein